MKTRVHFEFELELGVEVEPLPGVRHVAGSSRMGGMGEIENFPLHRMGGRLPPPHDGALIRGNRTYVMEVSVGKLSSQPPSPLRKF